MFHADGTMLPGRENKAVNQFFEFYGTARHLLASNREFERPVATMANTFHCHLSCAMTARYLAVARRNEWKFNQDPIDDKKPQMYFGYPFDIRNGATHARWYYMAKGPDEGIPGKSPLGSQQTEPAGAAPRKDDTYDNFFTEDFTTEDYKAMDDAANHAKVSFIFFCFTHSHRTL